MDVSVFSDITLKRSRDVFATRLVTGLSVRMVKSKTFFREDEVIFFGYQCMQSIDDVNSDTYLKKWKQHNRMLPIKASNQITSTSASYCSLNHDALLP